MRRVDVGSTPTGLDPVRGREHYQRLVLAGSVRLVCDSSSGLRTLLGDLMGLTETRALLRVYAEPDVGVPGRLEINMGGNACWLPVITRWAQPTGHGWALSVDFDRLTAEKRAVVRGLVHQHQIATAR